MISRENWNAIKWWEPRRISYTLLITAFAVFSYFLANSIIRNYAQDGEDYLNPSVLLVGIPFSIIVANILYALAWIIFEHAFGNNPSDKRSRRLRTIAFCSGLGLSVAILSFPVWVALFRWQESTH